MILIIIIIIYNSHIQRTTQNNTWNNSSSFKCNANSSTPFVVINIIELTEFLPVSFSYPFYCFLFHFSFKWLLVSVFNGQTFEYYVRKYAVDWSEMIIMWKNVILSFEKERNGNYSNSYGQIIIVQSEIPPTGQFYDELFCVYVFIETWICRRTIEINCLNGNWKCIRSSFDH